MREYSIGDYVLNGGEVAVSVMLEAITRLLPGFMGNAASIVEESYTGENALLEHRQYTKPAEWRGIKVPDVLLSGNHAKVDRFRRDEALEKTNELRPDLIEALDCAKLDKADRKTLMSLGWEVSGPTPASDKSRVFPKAQIRKTSIQDARNIIGLTFSHIDSATIWQQFGNVTALPHYPPVSQTLPQPIKYQPDCLVTAESIGGMAGIVKLVESHVFIKHLHGRIQPATLVERYEQITTAMHNQGRRSRPVSAQIGHWRSCTAQFRVSSTLTPPSSIPSGHCAGL